MPSVIHPLPGNEALAARLARALGVELGVLATRRFPDGESYLRLDTPVSGRTVALACTLDRPDEKLALLLLAALTARDLGASRVGLVAPYLAYMRQDHRFQPGEAVSSTCFGRILSPVLDWLVTVDPHLHRHRALAECYAIPCHVAQSAPLVAAWIAGHVRDPVVVGPDAESGQWVAAVAAAAGAPHVVLRKVRRGDRDVGVSAPDLSAHAGRTPVVVDDIVSTASTLIETVRELRAAGLPAPTCIAIHGVFAGTAERDLVAAGAARVVSSSTIPHPTSAIDVTDLVAATLAPLLA
jgi:ribose-phosphate pyrophosphokinase